MNEIKSIFSPVRELAQQIVIVRQRTTMGRAEIILVRPMMQGYLAHLDVVEVETGQIMASVDLPKYASVELIKEAIRVLGIATFDGMPVKEKEIKSLTPSAKVVPLLRRSGS